jgi:hypothetical protein
VSTIYALGADPGRHGGLALVALDPPGLPRLVKVWKLVGADRRLWWARCNAAHGEAVELLSGFGVALHDVRIWIEDPPPVARKHSLPGDKHGMQSWAGIGRMQGMIIGAALIHGFKEPELVSGKAWWSLWGRQIRHGKSHRDDGKHRITEASHLVLGAGDALEEIPDGCRVDCAEACLIAGAAALFRVMPETTRRGP